jgi:hypothetical protein
LLPGWGSINSGFGGAIYNQGILNIQSSTIADNLAGDESSGGIFNSVGPYVPTTPPLKGQPPRHQQPSIVTIVNSTLYGNQADEGGGITNIGTQVTIDNSTIAGNAAVDGAGGGIARTTTLNLSDTIVAGNSASLADPDLAGTLTSSGYNLIGNSQGGSGFATTDLLNVNPLLGPLQNNGGPTQTMALLPDSPAIGAGTPTFTGLAYDQRGPGNPRVVNGALDVGAFEVQNTASQLVTTASLNLTAGSAFTFTHL